MQKIGPSVFNNITFLNKLTKSKSERKRQRLLRLATTEELCSIINSASNLIKGRFKLTTRQRNRLAPHLAIVRKIGRSRSDQRVKRLLQRGGGLAALPAILVPILIEAFKFIKSSKDGQ
jgi:hypothetical protein